MGSEPSNEKPDATVRWPIVLWLSQLVVPAPVLAYGLHRMLYGPPPGRVLAPAMVVSVCWFAAVVAAAALSGGRRALIDRRQELSLCFAATVGTLVLGDLGLSVTGIVPTVASDRARSLEYRQAVMTRHRLIPKLVLRDDRPSIPINRRGFRGPEIATPKPAGTLRFVFLGGSQVFDFDGDDWPRLVENSLRESGAAVDAVNAGIPGHQTADSIGKLVGDLWQLEPDILVVCHGWNDIKYFSQLASDRPYRDLVRPYARDWRLRPTGIDRFLCASALYRLERRRVISTLRGEGGSPRRVDGRVGELGLRQFRLNLRTLCDIGANIGARVVLCKQARLPVAGSSESDRRRITYEFVGLPHDELVEAFAQCDRIVDGVATEKGCRVIDMNEPLSGKSELFVDHIHFSPAGSRQAAEVVAKRLKPLVEQGWFRAP